MTPPLRHARPVPLRKTDLPTWIAWPSVVVLTGASFGLALFDLSKRSLWLDEGITWVTTIQSVHKIVSISSHQGYHLLPYYLIVHLMGSLFGYSEIVLRLPSVVAGALAVPLLYLLVCRLGGRLAGLYASVLFVVSEPLVYWQQNARDYALVVFFAVASTFAAVVACQEERMWIFIVWGVVTGLGCFTHPEILLLLPPQLVVLLVWSRSLRTRLTLLAITAVGALVSLPVIGEASHSSVYQVTSLAPPNHESATEIATFLASAAGVGPVTPIDHALLGITFAIVIVGVAVLGADVVERGCTALNLGLGLGLAWLVIPPVLSWLVSESGRPDFLDRYVILSLPASAATVALVLIRLEPRALGAFALVYLTIFRAGVLVGSYHWPVDDYRGASRIVLLSAEVGDCITFSGDPGRILWDYYAERIDSASHYKYVVPHQVLPYAVNGPPAVVLRYASLTAQQLEAAQLRYKVAQAAPGCRRIWVMQSHIGNPTGSADNRYRYQSFLDLNSHLSAFYRNTNTYSYAGVRMAVWTRIRPPTAASP